jgi:hypothetical protein
MSAFLAQLRCELRLRGRRTVTLAAILIVIAASWLMLDDPAGGSALMSIDHHRLRYSSGTLAFGSASLGALLLTLEGFYLVRGRTQEDLRCGIAGVLAATPVSNVSLLVARWLGGTAYLLVLAAALLVSTLVLHLVRGEGPLQPGIYLQTYGLAFVPAMMFAAAAAQLADACKPLMGRRGDVAYFILWVVLLAVFPMQGSHAHGQLKAWMLLDPSGLVAGIVQLCRLLGSGNISIGDADFDARLALVDFPHDYWTGGMVSLRLGSCMVSLLLIGLAVVAFHRCAPDRLNATLRSGSGVRLPARLVQRALDPASRAVGALLPLVARLPPGPAAAVAELLVSLVTQPLALVWLVIAWIGPPLGPASDIWAWQAGIALFWGLWASELGARHAQTNTADLGAALSGGGLRRYASRWSAAWLLAMMGNASIVLLKPHALPPLAAGYALLAAVALLLGHLTRSGRSFLALFMLWLLVAVQSRHVAWVDLLGFNGGVIVAADLLAAILLLGLGLVAGRNFTR